MPETITKLRPDRDLQCYYLNPSAIAALSQTSASGFTVSGSWRQQFDWAVLEWNRDNVFEHPALRNLPDGDLSGIHLSYQETRTNCIQLDSTWFPTVDWPNLRIWDDSVSPEVVHQIPLKNYATAVGSYVAPTVTLALQGTITSGDVIQLAWLEQHFFYQVSSSDTLSSAINSLAFAINQGPASPTPMLVTAVANGSQITLTYIGSPGTNGNRVGVYGSVQGGGTESWSPASGLFSGGQSPAAWQIDLDFSNLKDVTGAVVATTSVRKLRWTWAADIQPVAYQRSEFAVNVTNWTVTGTNLTYSVAGSGSRRIEDSALDSLAYHGSWNVSPQTADPVEPISYSGGTIHWTSTPGDSVNTSYSSPVAHSLYLGTRCAANGGLVSVQVDGGAVMQFNLSLAGEDVLSRKFVGPLAAGTHQVTITHTGAPGTYIYFDFLEIAIPTQSLPDFAPLPSTTLATDWDTLHSQALAPERTAWLIQKLGFQGRANHYAGALWFYELVASGQQYASATVTFSGSPVFGSTTQISLGPTSIPHINLLGETPANVATAFALLINAGSTGVWAQANGAVLTITARGMGLAGEIAFSASPNTGAFTALCSDTALAGAQDVKWLTDLAAVPRINRAARDWNSSFFKALQGYGLTAATAFSTELGNGDGSLAAGIAQRYPPPNLDPVLVNTPALQTNFSPTSLAYWQEVYAEMAGLMANAGLPPYLQFGEVQWWYFANGAGMPFYDAYTTGTFQAQFGRPLPTVTSENTDPSGLTQECAFLAGLIGQFTSAIRQFVRQQYPTAKFEVLYPHDTNNTPLDRIVNFPTGDWTPANLVCLKTENFTYTGDRNLDQSRQSINFPALMGFPPSQTSHLIGISDYTTPWARERSLAIASGCESIVLFALDQFCLVGYELPLNPGSRQARFMGA